MDENKIYSAEDFLRYAHGQMPVVERHALEKAALEDPFLAEALDGYVEQVNGAMVNKSIVNDGLLVGELSENILQLTELRKIIAEKTADKNDKKQVPVVSVSRNKWLQTAVAAVFIAGAAWWLYAVSNGSKGRLSSENNKQIAQVQPPVVADSIIVDTTPKQTKAANPAETNITSNQQQAKVSVDTTPVINKVLAGKISGTEVAGSTDVTRANETAPPKKMADSTIAAAPPKDIALNNVAASPSANAGIFKKENTSKTVVMGFGTQKKTEPELQNVTVFQQKPSFVFQGRVLDANNNPLPFSNIVIPGENFGTYSDGEGYFNFVSTDSVLPVRAKSLGFETQNFTMSAKAKENLIVLNDDKNMDKNLTFFRSAKLKKSSDFKPTIVQVDSIASNVEPFVGWKNYDLYLANNNRISDLPLYSNRSVLLSFDVTNSGEIKNITVDRSQGKDLDAEAIRLLKEGPKWKAKKNGEKGKIEVKF